MKTCTTCKIKKPISAFWRNRKNGNTFRSSCKNCCRHAVKAWIKSNKPTVTATKVCIKCDRKLSITKFGLTKYTKDGNYNVCCQCRNMMRAIVFSRYTFDTEQFTCRGCGKCQPANMFNKNKHNKSGHDTKCKSCYHKYYLSRKGRVGELVKLWRKKNRLRSRLISLIGVRKRRAMKRGVTENITARHIKIIMSWFHQCIKCGSKKHLTIDHFNPLSKGYRLSMSNIIVLCRSCNSSKGNKNPELYFTPAELKNIKKLIKHFNEFCLSNNINF